MAMQQSTEVTLCTLPNEILFGIFSSLSFQDLCSVCLTNRRLYNVTADQLLWLRWKYIVNSKNYGDRLMYPRFRAFEIRGLSSKELSGIYDFFCGIESAVYSLNMEEFYLGDSQLEDFIEYFPRLTELRLYFQSPDAGDYRKPNRYMFQKVRPERLDIQGQDYHSNHGYHNLDLLLSMRNLRSLICSGIRPLSVLRNVIHKNVESLQTLELSLQYTDEAFLVTLTELEGLKLESLTLKRLQEISWGNGIQAIIARFPSLRHLSLVNHRFSGATFESTLGRSLSTLHHLTHLNLSRTTVCGNILYLPLTIQWLDVSGTELKRINLSQCSNLLHVSCRLNHSLEELILPENNRLSLTLSFHVLHVTKFESCIQDTVASSPNSNPECNVIKCIAEKCLLREFHISSIYSHLHLLALSARSPQPNILLDPTFVSSLARCTGLKQLSLTGTVTNSDIHRIPLQLGMYEYLFDSVSLTHLDLSGFRLPSFIGLRIARTQVSLVSLAADGSDSWDDEVFKEFIQKCSRLRRLSMKSCRRVTPEFFSWLCDVHPPLHHLEIGFNGSATAALIDRLYECLPFIREILYLT